MFRVLNCLTVEHDWRLVLLAALVCFLASVTAVNLFRCAQSTTGRGRATWIVTAGAATGCGIWATHFIAMLAYEPGVRTAYDIGLTALSLVAAVGITGIGLSIAVFRPTRWSAPAGGAILGGGIACMHYLGMWALEVPGWVTWDLHLVTTSVALGMLFGMGALAVAVRHMDMRGTFGAALLLTLAIVSHHFTAMGAVEIVADPTRAVAAYSLSTTALAFAVAGAAVAVLGMCLIGAIADRRLAARTEEFDLQMGELARDRQRIIEQSNEELERLNKGLERLVEERTADLQATRSMLEATLENVNQGIMMIDADRRVPVCNRRVIELLELPTELMESRPRWDEVVEYLRTRGEFEESGAGDGTCWRSGEIQHYQRRRPNGVVLDVRAIPLAGGGTVRTFTDITELLTKERLSALGQLTATVAHELRNPLSAIRNTLPVISEMTAGKAIVLDRPLARIERSISRCDQLVTGLLNYTRPAVLNCKPTEIDAWLGSVLDEQIIPPEVMLERKFRAPECVVNLDPDRLRRVIINLIDNAAQAIVQGTVSNSGRKITVCTKVSDKVEIIVADTGPGIAPEVLPRIFEPLFSTKNFGTGLGLPTVKQLVEQHGGTIVIESQLGQGAIVRIHLPFASQQRIAA